MELEADKKPNLRIDTIEGAEGMRQFSGLLDRSFPVSPGGHFFDDFPVWDERLNVPTPTMLRFGVYAEETLVASTGVRIAQMKTPSGTLPVGLIGAVTTDEKWRSRGIASQLVTMARDWAVQRNVALVLLWGSEHALYRNLGFGLCGEQIRTPLGAFKPAAGAAVQVNEGLTHGVFKKLRERTTGLAIQPSDASWYTAHKNVRWFWTGTADNPTAWAGYGRGIDLQGLVHEWGGSKEPLLGIISHIAKDNPHAELLSHPRHLQLFGMQADPSKIEFLCMAHISDPVRCLKAFAPRENWQLEKEEDDWVFIKGTQRVAPLTELGSVIFGPEKTALFNGVLPLPLWIWGLDGA